MIIKSQILDYMMTDCLGVRKAKPRHEICEALVLEDRLFRRIALELKREGHIATTASDGYFGVPLVCNDPVDIEAIKHSINDMRARAYDLLETAKAMAERLEQKTSKQMELAYEK
jgi:hypothetical protein